MRPISIVRSPLSRTALVAACAGLVAYGLTREQAEWSAVAAVNAGETGAEGARAHPAVVVDSVFPMDEELRRFRMGLDEVTQLTGGAGSREELVDLLLRAVERSDTAAVAALALTRGEFAWLYFSYSMFVKPPYELSPALAWFQIQNSSAAGLDEVLREHSGRKLYDTGVTCPDDGKSHGPGHAWDGCRVAGQLPSGERVEEALFGTILEWKGRYKLVSFTHRD
jgi:hypothetical protein